MNHKIMVSWLVRRLWGLCLRPFSVLQTVLHGDGEPLQGSFSRGPLTQGARPAVATLGCDVSPLRGCRGRLNVAWFLSDG